MAKTETKTDLLQRVDISERLLRSVKDRIERGETGLAALPVRDLRAQLYRLAEALDAADPLGGLYPSTPAERVALRTGDAYMADSYGLSAWLRCAKFLLDNGLTEREAEAVMRSKAMRWADDGKLTNRESNVVAFKRFFENHYDSYTGAKLRELVVQTFGEGEAA